jgi:hypothetical protein
MVAALGCPFYLEVATIGPPPPAFGYHVPVRVRWTGRVAATGSPHLQLETELAKDGSSAGRRRWWLCRASLAGHSRGSEHRGGTFRRCAGRKARHPLDAAARQGMETTHPPFHTAPEAASAARPRVHAVPQHRRRFNTHSRRRRHGALHRRCRRPDGRPMPAAAPRPKTTTGPQSSSAAAAECDAGGQRLPRTAR